MIDWWLWGGFIVLAGAMLFFDIFILGSGKHHEVSSREARIWSWTWISLALIFGAGVWWQMGQAHAVAFMTAYLLEKSLSVDNILVFILIFKYFSIPPALQRRVLLWGVVGAILFRLITIFLKDEAVLSFHWLLVLFGLVLIATGLGIFFLPDSDRDLASHPLLNWIRRHFNLTEGFHGVKFFVRKRRVVFFTPLLLAFIFVALTDFVFAINSVPVMLSITKDLDQNEFIMFTSNIFAILGLRALFFSLSGWMGRFHWFKYGMGLVLLFVGAKMLELFHVSVLVSLGLVGLILAVSIGLSLVLKPEHFTLKKR